jgi:hypothetical protein
MRLVSGLKERLVDRVAGSPPGDRNPRHRRADRWMRSSRPAASSRGRRPRNVADALAGSDYRRTMKGIVRSARVRIARSRLEQQSAGRLAGGCFRGEPVVRRPSEAIARRPTSTSPRSTRASSGPCSRPAAHGTTAVGVANRSHAQPRRRLKSDRAGATVGRHFRALLPARSNRAPGRAGTIALA